jgi:glycosyltransferase involved in cell wall biosynthesis
MIAKIGVLHIIDSLNIGGAERVAVNIANLVHSEGKYQSHLCVTRQMGFLQNMLIPGIPMIFLNKKFSLDPCAFYKLINYIRKNNIAIIHAHSSSLFMAALVKMVIPKIRIVWHIHFGALSQRKKSIYLFRFLLNYVSKVFVVNQELLKWVTEVLEFSEQNVYYLANFVCLDFQESRIPLKLPGDDGKRIVCVANLRPEKDHMSLIRAMRLVVDEIPSAHLILVGAGRQDEYQELIFHEVNQLGLMGHITWLGEREDVFQILQFCSIGVLSSVSEGLPLALLEYGSAGLPVVATNVGEVPYVLENGDLGLLVNPKDECHLASSLIQLLKEPELRKSLGESFKTHVREKFNPVEINNRIHQVYENIIK